MLFACSLLAASAVFVLSSSVAAAQSKLVEAETKLETVFKEDEERQKSVQTAAATLEERIKTADVAKRDRKSVV